MTCHSHRLRPHRRCGVSHTLYIKLVFRVLVRSDPTFRLLLWQRTATKPYLIHSVLLQHCVGRRILSWQYDSLSCLFIVSWNALTLCGKPRLKYDVCDLDTHVRSLLLMNYLRRYCYLIRVKALRLAIVALWQRCGIVKERLVRESLASSRPATILFLMRPADTLTKQ